MSKAADLIRDEVHKGNSVCLRWILWMCVRCVCNSVENSSLDACAYSLNGDETISGRVAT